MMKLVALAAVIGVAAAQEAKDAAGCEQALQMNLLDPEQTQEDRCGHIAEYASCLQKFPGADDFSSVVVGAKIKKVAAAANCGEGFLDEKVAVKSDASIAVVARHEAEAVFHRHRRETVSVFNLDAHVTKLTTDLAQEKIDRLTGDNDNLKAIGDAVKKVEESKAAGNAARAALKEALEAAQAKVEASTGAAVTSTTEGLNKKIADTNTDLTKLVNAGKEDTAKNVAANKAAVDAIVDGVAAAVPKLSCSNKKTDGAETDVDCGGPYCAKCGKAKKCKFSSDCAASVCVEGTCTTCKVKGDGKIAVRPGVEAFCVGGRTQPTRAQAFLEFTTCGHTGPYPPDENDCLFEYSLRPAYNSLHETYMEWKDGFQIFTAPVDGDYRWEVYGAKGGTDYNCCGGHDYNRHGKGGDGGRVIATQKGVKAGTKFYMRIGQRGRDCIDTHNDQNSGSLGRVTCPTGSWHVSSRGRYETQHGRGLGFNACGGFNGGGPARCLNDPGGSSGGGGTDIRQCAMGGGCVTPPNLKQRFLVAGGGGGGSCENNDGHGCGSYARWGGHGGADSGENGYDNGYNGYGGSQSSGGNFQSGRSSEGATRGIFGQGGSSGVNDAGGGGGGYWGGGGADHNSGGGGGSNFYQGTSDAGTRAAGNINLHNNDRGNNRGEGYIRLQIQG